MNSGHFSPLQMIKLVEFMPVECDSIQTRERERKKSTAF